MDRARLAKVAAGIAVLGAAVVAVSSEGAGGATAPVVSLSATQINRVEGSAGASTVMLTAGLSGASTTAVQVAYATVPASAKATDGDYLTKRGTLTFPPGVVSQSITVQVNGDTKLEDHEIFRVKLSKPVGATLGNAKEKIQIQNDELPNVVVSPVTVNRARPSPSRPSWGSGTPPG